MADAKTKVEPVAWRWKIPIPEEIQGSKFAWEYAGHWSTPPSNAEVEPLYAAPQPAASDVPHDVVRGTLGSEKCTRCKREPLYGGFCTRDPLCPFNLDTPAPSTSTDSATEAELRELFSMDADDGPLEDVIETHDGWWQKRSGEAVWDWNTGVELSAHQPSGVSLATEALAPSTSTEEALRAENARLRAALEFYADENPNGLPNEGPWGAGSDDFGNRARKALSALSR